MGILEGGRWTIGCIFYFHRKKDGVDVKDSSDTKMEISDRGGNVTARLTMTNVDQTRWKYSNQDFMRK